MVPQCGNVYGGAAAATACDFCIYFARQGGGTPLSYDIKIPQRERLYSIWNEDEALHPSESRRCEKLSMFIEGFSRYLADRGKSALRCLDLTAAKVRRKPRR